MHPRRSRALAFSIAALLLAAGGCDSTPTETNAPPVALTVDPATGPPGTIIALSGFSAGPADLDHLTAYVGGLESAIFLSPTGQWLTAVPLLAAGPDGRSAPPAPVSVELLRDGMRVALAESAFAVQDLSPAPGATRATQSALASVGAEMARITQLLDTTVGAQEQWTTSFASALDSLLDSSDPHSLGSVLSELEQQSPETLALLDAYLSASGVLERTQAVAIALQAVAPDTLGLEKNALRTPIGQLALARKMQFQSVLKLFGKTVIHDTAEQYAYTVGMVTGLVGIGAPIPAASEVAAIMAVADFAVNKVIVGLYPSIISNFHIALEDTSLSLGDITTAQILIEARNEPPSVGIQDFIGLTLNLLGLRAGPSTDSFRDILTSTASFYLATVQQFISTYSDNHPEASLDVSMSVVPHLSWNTVLTDARLVDCKSHTPSTITGLTDVVNWKASSTIVGEGRIYAMTATGPAATLITLPPLFTYNGGAFGEQVAATPTVSVTVTGQIGLNLDFPTSLQEGESQTLTVVAGYQHPDTGNLIGAAGIHIEILVDGGTVANPSGTTGGGGVFTTIAGADLGSTGLILSVTARDDTGQSATQSLDVTVGSVGVSVESTQSSALSVARTIAQGVSDEQVLSPFSVETVNLQTRAHSMLASTKADASSTLNASMSMAESGRVIVFSSNANASLAVSYERPAGSFDFADAAAGASWDCGYGFVVTGAPVPYTLSMQFDAGGATSSSSQGFVSLTSGEGFEQTFVDSGGSVSGVLEPGSYGLTFSFHPVGQQARADPGDAPKFSQTINSSGSFTLTIGN